MDLNQVKIIDSKGQVVVNHAWLQAEGRECVLIYVNLASKDCDVTGHGANDKDVPGVLLELNSLSHHAGTSRPTDDGTYLDFPEYKGWSVFCASTGKYSAHVALIKNRS